MIIKITNIKASELFLNGEFYKTNELIDVPFTVAQRLGRLATVEMMGEPKPYNPDLFHTENKFTFLSDIDDISGWGNVSINLIKYSTPKFDIAQIGRVNNVRDPVVEKASRIDINPESAIVIHEQPKEEWLKLPFERKIAIVPFETSIIPDSWIHRINHCSALLVPCVQNIEAFRKSGVTIPIELIHWGVDTSIFYELDRVDDGIFTFGTMGALSNRKGTDILIDAFLKAFPTEKDVRLLCKTSNYSFFGAVRDKRVKINCTPVSYEDLRNDFFMKTDCFVFPTRGEGFGLTPLEAMATGIPAIVTNWSGPVEYMNEDVGWKLNYSLRPATEFSDPKTGVYKENCGDWAEPSLDHLVELMRYAYEHQDAVKKKGKFAAEYVRQKWSWGSKIYMFHEALNKHL